MTNRFQIDCIRKTHGQKLPPHITHISGKKPDGHAWKISHRYAIDSIEAGNWEFYINTNNGENVKVVVAKSSHGSKFLKTELDGDTPENLLQLPEFPVVKKRSKSIPHLARYIH